MDRLLRPAPDHQCGITQASLQGSRYIRIHLHQLIPASPLDKRKVEVGTCGRPYGTSCQHEHACIRCSVLHVDSRMMTRLDEIEADLTTRRDTARKEGWHGEIEGMDLTLSLLLQAGPHPAVHQPAHSSGSRSRRGRLADGGHESRQAGFDAAGSPEMVSFLAEGPAHPRGDSPDMVSCT